MYGRNSMEKQKFSLHLNTRCAISAILVRNGNCFLLLIVQVWTMESENKMPVRNNPEEKTQPQKPVSYGDSKTVLKASGLWMNLFGMSTTILEPTWYCKKQSIELQPYTSFREWLTVVLRQLFQIREQLNSILSMFLCLLFTKDWTTR